MDATFNSQDFAPPFHSTARPAAQGDFEEEDDDADLLAAVDMADAASQIVMAERRRQPVQKDPASEEVWDDEDLVKIAELQQSIQVGDMMSDTAAGMDMNAGPGGEHRDHVTHTTGPQRQQLGDSVATLKGENQVLRDRQVSYERQVRQLKEQMLRQAEQLKAEKARDTKHLQDTIEKLTTTLQFKDQGVAELRKENERQKKTLEQQNQSPLKLHKQQQQQQPPPKGSVQTADSDFPTLTTFHSQTSPSRAQVKRSHSTLRKETTEEFLDIGELAAKRRRTASPRRSTSSTQAVELNITMESPTVDQPSPVDAKKAKKKEACSRPFGDLTSLPSDLLSCRRPLSSTGSGLLHNLLKDSPVTDEVYEVCNTVGLQHIDILGILEVNCASSTTPTLDSNSSTRHTFALSPDFQASAAAGSKKPTLAYGTPRLASSVKSQFLRRVLCHPSASTPQENSMTMLLDKSLSTVCAGTPPVLGVWLSRIHTKLSALCSEIGSGSDSTPELLPAPFLQQSSQSSSVAATCSASTSVPAGCQRLNNADARKQQRAVELLCALDHLLKCSNAACVALALAQSSASATRNSTYSRTSMDLEPETPSTADTQYQPMSGGGSVDSSKEEQAVQPAGNIISPHGLIFCQPVFQVSRKLDQGGKSFAPSPFSHRIFCEKVSVGNSAVTSAAASPVAFPPSPWRAVASLQRVSSITDLRLAPNTRVALPAGGGGGAGSPQPSVDQQAAQYGKHALASIGKSHAVDSDGHLALPTVVPGESPLNKWRPTPGPSLPGNSAWFVDDDPTVQDASCKLRGLLIRLLRCKEASELPLSVVAGSVLATAGSCLTLSRNTPQSSNHQSLCQFVQGMLSSGALHRSLTQAQPSIRVQALRITLELCAHPAVLDSLCIPDNCLLKLIYACLADTQTKLLPRLAAQCLHRLLSCHGNKALSLLLLRECSCPKDLLRSLVTGLRNGVRVVLTDCPHGGTVSGMTSDCARPRHVHTSCTVTEERSKPSSQLLVIRQIISIFHIVMLSFDHANAMAMYFHADPSLVNSYMSVVFQLRHYFERLEQETGEKLLEVTMLSTLWDFLTDCGSPNHSCMDTSSSQPSL